MIWSSPLALAFAQIAVVSLGALPVFWLGRRHLGSENAVAGLLALGYLAYPWTATSAVGAIHPVTFAIPLLLFCVWFLDTNRLLPFAAVRRARDVDGRADGTARSSVSASGTRSLGRSARRVP